MLLKLGSSGEEVAMLQNALMNAGFFPWPLTGDFDEATKIAVMAYQGFKGLKVDGLVGRNTFKTLGYALPAQPKPAPPTPERPATEEPTTLPPMPAAVHPDEWAEFEDLIEMLTGGFWRKGQGVVGTTYTEPVKYGPGRGHHVKPDKLNKAGLESSNADGSWVVTRGPLGLGENFKNKQGVSGFPSFHCSSFTNWFAAWLLNLWSDYTHSGNRPPLRDLCSKSRGLHENEGMKKYRGYGPWCREIKPRSGETFRMPELLERLPREGHFFLAAQSSLKSNGKWKWWHHTVVFFVAPDGQLYRIAADGGRGSGGVYSGTPMDVEKITPEVAKRVNKTRQYYVFAVLPRGTDGRYAGDGQRPPVILEA